MCFAGLVFAARVNAATVTAWGQNSDGQANPPASLSNSVTIASAGGYHGLALLTNGTVQAWGTGSQVIVPNGISNVVAIAGGGAHNVVLRNDGTLAAWGNNVYGQSTVPSGMTNVVGVFSGGDHNLILSANGTLKAWGRNTEGQSTVPAGLSNIVTASGNLYHSLALRTNRTVAAWGYNGYGQCNVPANLNNVVAIAAGGLHSLALLENGTVVAWGYNDSGQTSVPAGATNVVAIAAGYNLSLALKANGQVVAWGGNAYLQRNVPAGLTNATAISAGAFFGLALKGTNAPFLAPSSLVAQLLLGQTAMLRANASGSLPLSYKWFQNGVEIPGATNSFLTFPVYSTASAGTYSVMASNAYGFTTGNIADLSVIAGAPILLTQPASQTINPGGSALFSVSVTGATPLAYQWRFNGTDIPGATASALILDPVSTNQAGVYSVRVTNSFGSVTSASAILNIAQVISWGNNSDGQTNVPPDLTDIVAISAGAYHPLVMKSDGTLLSWGTGAQAFIPISLGPVLNFSGGGVHSAALKPNNTVAVWGNNTYGQSVVPSDVDIVTAVSAGGQHNLVITLDGKVRAWGRNTEGQANVPAGLSNVVAVSGGSYHSLALRRNGTVAAWGLNTSGQITVPGTLTNVIAIAAGGLHSLALRQDGSVITWGDNSRGQLNLPAGMGSVLAISAGYQYSAALNSNGQLMIWGANEFGQGIVPGAVSNPTAFSAGDFFNLALFGAKLPYIGNSTLATTVTNLQSVSFQANAFGALPLYYQWKRNGADIPSATNVWLTLTNSSVADSGIYSVMVSNSLGTATATIANLNVLFKYPSLSWTKPADIIAGNALDASQLNAAADVPGSFTYSPPAGTILPRGTNQTLSVTFVPNDSALETVTASTKLDVLGVSQTITVDSITGKIWGDVPFDVSATASSGLPVSLSIQSGPATLNGNTLTLTGTGLVSLRAIQLGDSIFLPVTNLVSFSVQKAPQSITFGAIGNKTLPQAPLTLAATASSGLPVTLSIVAGPATISGSTLTLTNTGIVTVRGSQAGNGNYLAAANIDQSFLVTLTSGKVIAWGSNVDQQTNVPPALTNVIAISAGGYHPLALKKDGSVVSWAISSQAVVPTNLGPLLAVSAGGGHSLGIRSNGTVVAWGYNTSGQLNVPPFLSDVLAVAAGGDHSLAIRNDRTVVAWGKSSEGQTTVPAVATNVVAISGGSYHSLALRGDGSVVAWGFNSEGSTIVPPSATNVIAIAAGGLHNVALRQNGTVVAWGNNFAEQINVPAGLTNVIAVDAGDNFSMALKADGSIVTWGGNTHGQRTIPSSVTFATSISAGSFFGMAAVGDPFPRLPQLVMSRSLAAGNSVTLNAPAYGMPPLSFQWSFNNAPIPGATNAMLSLTNVQANMIGSYSLLVTNLYGSATGVVANVTFPALISWQTPADIVYGTPLGSQQLNATANVPGVFTYNPPLGTLLNSGNGRILSVLFTPEDSVTFGPAATTVPINVLKAPQTVTFEDPGQKVFGDPPFAVTATASSGMQILYVVMSGPGRNTGNGNVITLTGAGVVVVRAIQLGGGNYLPAPYVDLSIIVEKATPVVTWPNPADIACGTPLGAAQLNATASVQGTFTYSPPAGTVLDVGAQILNVTFLPTDSANYKTVTASVNLNVYKGEQTIWVGPPGNKRSDQDPFPMIATASSGLPVDLSVVSGPATVSGNVITLNGTGVVTVRAMQPGNGNYHPATTVERSFRVLSPATRIYGAGGRGRGQLTGGPQGNARPPVVMTFEADEVAAGGNHTFFLKRDGTLWAVGANEWGQLGDGTTTDKDNPVQVATGVRRVVTSGMVTCFIKTDGTLWGMGRNSNGELGRPASYIESTPVQIATNAFDVAIGDYHTLFIKKDGSLHGMGFNYYGQLGIGQTFPQQTPVHITNDVISIAAGNSHSLFVKSDGTLWGMGGNFGGALGDGTTNTRTTPVQIATGVSTVAAPHYFGNHSLYIKADGTLWGMGYNAGGQLGDGTLINRLSPLQIATGVCDMVGSQVFSLFLREDGTLWGMGIGGSGELGEGGIFRQPTPVKVADGVVTVTAGNVHSLFATSDGGRVIWTNPPDIVFGVPIGLPQLNATSSVPGSFTYTPSSGTVLNAGTAQLLSVIFTPNDPRYNTEAVSVSINVLKASQTVSFDPVGSKTFGDAPFTVSATASSGLSVEFSIVSGPATISGNSITITGASSVTVRASQPGNNNYNAAQSVDQTFVVAKATPQITWQNPADIEYGTPLGAAHLNASANIPGNFLYTPSADTILGVGNHQALNVTFTPTTLANYNPAFRTVEINVLKGSQAIAFGTIANKTYGDTPFSLVASASSTLPVTFNVTSGSATVSGNMVNLTGAGSVTIQGSQGGNSDFNAASSVQQTFVVSPATLTIKADDATRNYGAANPAFSAAVSGFVNGETLASSGVTGTPGFATVASEISAVLGSPYMVMPTVGTMSAANYTFIFVPGVLSITKAPLLVTGDNATRPYGAANPLLSVTITGFVNGETLASSGVAGTANVTTPATTASLAGFYPIVPALGTLNSENYNFVLVNGVLAISGGNDVAASAFLAPTFFPVGEGPWSLASGNFTSGTLLDLAVANNGNNSVSVLIGDGKGVFSATNSVGTGAHPTAVVAADFNRDGMVDLVTANGDDNTLSIAMGNGNGTFDAPIVVAAGQHPVAMATGDLNRDAYVDLVVANYDGGEIMVLRGSSSGLLAPTSVQLEPGLSSIAIADLKKDNFLDVIAVNSQLGTVTVLAGLGNGSFSTTTYVTSAGPRAIGLAVADYDGDTKLDVAVANQTENTVTVLLGNNGGGFTSVQSYPVAGNPVAVVPMIVTNSKPNLVVARFDDGSVDILPNRGNGTFDSVPATAHYPVGGNPVALVVADFNGDKDNDIAVAVSGDDRVAILLNNFMPKVQSQTLGLREDANVPIPLPPQGNAPVTYTLKTQPTKGVLSGDAPNWTYVPNPDENGTDSFSYTVANGVKTSAVAVVTLSIAAVNDPPEFELSTGNVVTVEDSGKQTNIVAINLVRGPANESSQTLSFLVSNSASNLFSAQPSISYKTNGTGALVFTPAANAQGTAVVSVRLKDNGGVANGGIDTSPASTFLITINNINDAPVITKPAVPSIPESGNVIVNFTATDLESSPDTLIYSIVGTTNATLFPDPSTNFIFGGSGSARTLRIYPAIFESGADHVSLLVSDGTNSAVQTNISITVSSINNAPSFDIDTARYGSGTAIPHVTGQMTLPNLAIHLSSGPANESSQTLSFTVTASNTAVFDTQPSINPTGALTFKPKPGTPNGTVVVLSIKIKDNGLGTAPNVNTSAAQNYTITITNP